MERRFPCHFLVPSTCACSYQFGAYTRTQRCGHTTRARTQTPPCANCQTNREHSLGWRDLANTNLLCPQPSCHRTLDMQRRSSWSESVARKRRGCKSNTKQKMSDTAQHFLLFKCQHTTLARCSGRQTWRCVRAPANGHQQLGSSTTPRSQILHGEKT